MNEETKNYIDLEEQDSKLAKKISLNFTDKDDKENSKFNDARLIDIIRNYPLLYNKCLESYGDPDYTKWMWGEVANEMNECHRKTSLNAPFTATDCQIQWENVKRALQYLCNPAAKSFRYPKHFRECLDFFQNYIKDRQEPTRTDRSRDYFVHQAQVVEQMPLEKQLLMEKEITNAILSNELEFCAPMIDPQLVESQAREEFGNVIGLLMPELDLQVVKNELSTEIEPNLLEDIIQQSDNSNVVTVGEQITDVSQLLELYSKSVITLKPAGTQLDLENLLELPPKQVKLLIPQAQKNIQYTIPEGILTNILNKPDGENVAQNVIVEQNESQHAVHEGTGQEVILQECVFQEDIMQEDLIEEVVPQGPGKDMPSLDMDGNFEVSNNRLDFSDLNVML